MATMVLPEINSPGAVGKLLERAKREPETLTTDEIAVVKEYDPSYSRAVAIQRLQEREARERPKQAPAPARRTKPDLRSVTLAAESEIVRLAESGVDWCDAMHQVATSKEHVAAYTPLHVASVLFKAVANIRDELDKHAAGSGAKSASDIPADFFPGLMSRLDQMSARLKTLEERPAVVYRGIWEEGQQYKAGDCVTWSGSMWMARQATTAKPDLPTAESRAWQLCVKRGATGKTGAPGRDATKDK